MRGSGGDDTNRTRDALPTPAVKEPWRIRCGERPGQCRVPSNANDTVTWAVVPFLLHHVFVRRAGSSALVPLSPLRGAMIFYVSWLALVAATTAVAQSSNANCSDSSYDWVSALALIAFFLLSFPIGHSRYSTRRVRVLAKLSRI
jgi:hypothetical protein